MPFVRTDDDGGCVYNGYETKLRSLAMVVKVMVPLLILDKGQFKCYSVTSL